MSAYALVEIDFQGWVLAATESEGVVERAVAVRAGARAPGAVVVCSRYLSRDPDDPERSDPVGPGASFVAELAPEAGDLVLTKYGRDLAENPDLDANLRLRGITDVVLTGVATEHGVSLTATSLAGLGYQVWVAHEGCAGVTRSEHEAALAELSGQGVRVVATEDLRWSALQRLA